MTTTSQFTLSEINGLVYKPHPRFLTQNLSKKVRLIHESLRYLRLLPTFAGALGEKNRTCTCASFNKIPTNYISVESLINLLYEKNIILAMFSTMCQEAVRHETTKGSSIEFIRYQIP